MSNDIKTIQPPEDFNHEPGKEGRRLKLLVIGAVAFGLVMFLIGYLAVPSRRTVSHEGHKEVTEHEDENNIRYWTCSMHPNVRMPEPGKCPICFMDLIPVYERAGGGDADGAVLRLSKTARELAEIETSLVESRALTRTLRMVGKIEYDETRLAHVSAWVGGRIDKLYINYVGVRVNKGDPLILLYSPELRTAQEEYLIADRRWKEATASGDESEIASALAVKKAIQKKLELWGILPSQIDKIGGNGGPDDHMTIYAPAGGTVIAREAFEGKYIEPGERLFTISDLAEVWANLDAYEIDLEWLRVGQTVEFETDVFPGETFKGKITFIQPILNEATRTVKVRVNVPNRDEHLKPGMYVRASLDVPVDESGRSLKKGTAATHALSIPATAPLLTGKRAVVYVEEREDDEPVYVGRQVELGPRAGNFYLVKSGLEEGERVVTRGNFKIDSALQIQARPSMMKPEGGEFAAGHQHGSALALAAQNQVVPAPAASREPKSALNANQPEKRLLPVVTEMKPVLEEYFSFAEALAKDDSARAATAITSLNGKLSAVNVHSAGADSHEKLAAAVQAINAALPDRAPTDLESQRKVLASLSNPIGNYLRTFQHGFDSSLYEAFCSMAFDGKGGTWYQKTREINNPYFGASMLRCGEIKHEFSPEKN